MQKEYNARGEKKYKNAINRENAKKNNKNKTKQNNNEKYKRKCGCLFHIGI